jgi:hypothetical protein
MIARPFSLVGLGMAAIAASLLSAASASVA